MGKADKTEKTAKKQKHFWKDFKAELKKVIWPTKSQVINNTVVVLVIVIIVTAIVFVLDLAFEALNTYGIDKLKTLVRDSVGSDDESNVLILDDNTVNEIDVNSVANEVSEGTNITENIVVPDDVANVENVS